MASSTLVESLPHHTKIKGLNTGKEKNVEKTFSTTKMEGWGN
jgi:hypothetical protein